MSSQIRTSTVVAVSVGTIAASFLAYAVYFDHRRRSDPEFRKALKRESKRTAKVAKEDAEKQGAENRQRIRAAVNAANDEGYPTDPQVVEEYFMQEVAEGEKMCQDGSDPIDAALCFYKALKVYPQPRELISIYDKTVPKPVLDILAEMIGADTSIPTSGLSGSQASAGSDRGDMD